MADEREGAHQPPPQPASETRIQSGGRQENAAQPLNAAEDRGGPERYPPGDRAVESRSFNPAADAPTPRPDAGDPSPDATQQGRVGPEGDPAEGKR